MKNILYFICVILVSCSKNRFLKPSEITGSDENIALILAENKWNEVYGKSTIKKEKPFRVQKKNDSIYIIKGSYPKDEITGVAYAEVNVKTRKVIKYTHGE
ncbi:NTF2 fold immunity protein [Chryseobacterium salviniae]|uniref:NTF2 fold immunity protein n=1 Tax=Chryseobacterium salviniae TaxID=3101750 RepID=A0ABU6HR69_9FLAO|nr:NTF2 fold immunity protein [Chryseobacterium sp. T9W2-O]MEC3875551.1 NTF2 fold immunity protein [Chryseobacterium sp. T9W2-O]